MTGASVPSSTTCCSHQARCTSQPTATRATARTARPKRGGAHAAHDQTRRHDLARQKAERTDAYLPMVARRNRSRLRSYRRSPAPAPGDQAVLSFPYPFLTDAGLGGDGLLIGRDTGVHRGGCDERSRRRQPAYRHDSPSPAHRLTDTGQTLEFARYLTVLYDQADHRGDASPPRDRRIANREERDDDRDRGPDDLARRRHRHLPADRVIRARARHPGRTQFGRSTAPSPSHASPSCWSTPVRLNRMPTNARWTPACSSLRDGAGSVRRARTGLVRARRRSAVNDCPRRTHTFVGRGDDPAAQRVRAREREWRLPMPNKAMTESRPGRLNCRDSGRGPHVSARPRDRARHQPDDR